MKYDFSYFGSPDWYHATTLAERIDSMRRNGVSKFECDDDTIRSRVERWQHKFPNVPGDYFSECSAIYDLNEHEFLHLMGEPIENVKNRLGDLPMWLQRLVSAFSTAKLRHHTVFKDVKGNNKTLLFLNLIEPLIHQALFRLREGAASIDGKSSPFLVAYKCVEEALLLSVARQLVEMLIPTLVLELNVARVRGLLPGETREQRFASFVERLREPHIAVALLAEYPALARQAVVCLDHWVIFSLELLRHLCEDWAELCREFGAGEDLGHIVNLDSKGDRHRGGRAVLIVSFSCGVRIVYKPRSLAVDLHFQELLEWLNQRGADPALRTIKVMNRGSHGWVEFIDAKECVSSEQAQRFYARHGEYLALLHAIEATDFHHENIIASAEDPIFIDLETLFHPSLAREEEAIDKTYRDSVLRIGLLPQRMFGNAQNDGIDLSGLGAAAGQPLPYSVIELEAKGTDEMRLIQRDARSGECVNQPGLNGVKLSPLDYLEQITAGFTSMYRLLEENREEVLAADGPLARFAKDTVRVVLRPTATYSLLLRYSLHPDAFQDAIDRDILFGSLHWQRHTSVDMKRILACEIGDLHNRDVPIFTSCPESCDIYTSSGERIEGFFPETGLSLVHRRVRQLGEGDYQRQLWFIRASLAATTTTVASPVRFPGRPSRKDRPGVHRDKLLNAAKAVGDRLHSLAIRTEKDISWIGLTLTRKDNWSLVPLSLDLYNGLPGVALFLAYLGAASQENRYTTLAESALATIRRQLLTVPIDELPIGAFDGWGGITYTFTHLGTLWDDPQLLNEAKLVATRSRILNFHDRNFDIISGAAGGVMSQLALHSVAPDEEILAAATASGDYLLSHAQPMQEGIGWSPGFPASGPLTGLAHGASGIAWALLELSAVSGEARFRDAAEEAISYENSLFSPDTKNWPDLREMGYSHGPRFMAGWCHGAPGIALTRLRALAYIDSLQVRSDIAAGLDTTLAQGFSGDHSLCHGSVGNLEVLLQASNLLDPTVWAPHVERLSARILQDIEQHGWLCSVPLAVESPGLMTGLAGIGYGLLRAANPAAIPAVLTLAAPVVGKTCGRR